MGASKKFHCVKSAPTVALNLPETEWKRIKNHSINAMAFFTNAFEPEDFECENWFSNYDYEFHFTSVFH